MIPVPREISAGCGLSWCADLKEREKVQEIMKRVGIEEEEIQRMYGVKERIDCACAQIYSCSNPILKRSKTGWSSFWLYSDSEYFPLQRTQS